MSEPDIPEFLRLYRFMLMSRRMDEMERQATNRGLAHFHVSGMGHEASAALAFALGEQDWLHCHYRDKALMLARGLTPLDFFLALFCKRASHSVGRQMSAHMASKKHNVLSIVGPVGNNALQAVGVAAALVDAPESPVVLASMGDGTTQQGEVLEAIAEAARSGLPVLFLVHDNGLAISTRTAGRTFFSPEVGCEPASFMGVGIVRLDGSRPGDCLVTFRSMVADIRQSRRPIIAILKCQRLDDHSNADDQRAYRTAGEIQVSAQADPIRNLRQNLELAGTNAEAFEAIEAEVSKLVNAAFDEAHHSEDPVCCTGTKAVKSASSDESGVIGLDHSTTLLDAMRSALHNSLQDDDRVVLYGQDIEDPKGDVFGLTRGLSTAFPDRVINAPLSEGTIIGTAIGRALAGQRPVAMIQFADFLPIAWNQISQEMATMDWRTGGQFIAPVVVMAVCGGYKAGLGPFHAQTSDSMAAHVPGLDVMVPASSLDASTLLSAALKSDRPTIFLYPKSLLNDRSDSAGNRNELTALPPGKARIERAGVDLTLVTWGGAITPSREAVAHAAGEGVSVELIDLRTLAPWDKATIVQSATRTGRLLVVHEDSLTGGFGAEIIASAVEASSGAIQCLRVTRPDTHIPCNYVNQLEILPGARRIVDGIAKLMGMDIEESADVKWAEPLDPYSLVVNAFGMSPSDDQVKVIRWFVCEGDAIVAGQSIAEVDSDKASGDVDAPADGVIAKLLADVGDAVRVGQPLFHIRTQEIVATQSNDKPLPRLVRRPLVSVKAATISSVARNDTPGEKSTSVVPGVKIYLPTGALGAGTRTNAMIAAAFPDTDAARIFDKTGIDSRPQVVSGESPVTLAWSAASEVITALPELVGQLEMIICSTSSVSQVCPSIAAQVLAHIQRSHPGCHAQAFDILATCSGYLYGLQLACDFLRQRPNASVLLLTSEVLSPLISADDLGSMMSFGDAATATWCLSNSANPTAGPCLSIDRPLCFATGDPAQLLTVPPLGTNGCITMEGGAVRQLTVPAMAGALRQAVHQVGLNVSQLERIIPHQTNQRIIADLARELGVSDDIMFKNLRYLGNTSSSTLPLAIRDYIPRNAKPGEQLGFVTFGGGFTYAAATGRLL